MPEREWRLFLDDILNSTQKIIRFTSTISFEEFLQDEKTFDAVMRNLEIIGEAVKQLPLSFREQNPQIEWKKIAGLRDIVIHEYFGINEGIIWDLIINKIPELNQKMKEIIG